MREGEGGGMQRDARETQRGAVGFRADSGDHLLVDLSFPAIKRVSKKGMTQSGEVHTNLMQPAGPRKNAYNTSFARSKRRTTLILLLRAKDGIYAIFGDGGHGSWDIHPLTDSDVASLAADRHGDRPFRRRNNTAHNGDVLLLDTVRFHMTCPGARDFDVFG